MNFKIVLMVAMVLFASTVTIATTFFPISTPEEVWENICLNSMVVKGGGFTPCDPIDCDDGPK